MTKFQKSSRHKITDWKRFQAFVQQHGGKTQQQMAKLWGDNVTQPNISDVLMKLGLSRKKRLTDTESAMNISRRSSRNDWIRSCRSRSSMWMKLVSITETIIPMATARWDNGYMGSNRVSAPSASVGLPRWSRDTCFHRWGLQDLATEICFWCGWRNVYCLSWNLEISLWSTTPVLIILRALRRLSLKLDVRWGLSE